MLAPMESEWVIARPLKYLGEAARQNDINWDAALLDCGLDPEDLNDPENHIGVRSALLAFEFFAEKLDNDARVFDVFDQAPVGYESVFDYVFLCASSLREGLRNWARFCPARSNCMTITYQENQHFAVLSFSFPDHFGPYAQFAYGFMGYLCGRIERVGSEGQALVRMEMSAKQPRHSSAFLERHSGQIAFDAEENRILLPLQSLQRVPESADPILFRIVEMAALQELEAVGTPATKTSAIAEKISQGLRAGDCSIEYVASSLGMSNRSLQRALENEGTSYRKVHDDVRRSIAQRYLVDTDIPIKEIAFLLGFSEVSAFSRAVRNWFGLAPRALRRQPSSGMPKPQVSRAP